MIKNKNSNKIFKTKINLCIIIIIIILNRKCNWIIRHGFFKVYIYGILDLHGKGRS